MDLNIPDNTTTLQLASRLVRIIGDTTDYRTRVDAISEALKGKNETTARTALVVALASSEPHNSNRL